MTIDGDHVGVPVACPRCFTPSEPGDRFCMNCGAVLDHAPPRIAAPNAHEPSVFDDATTRYLCAAAQLDVDFADDAIREHLVESTRAITPSPGVNSAAVLREAVAGRVRRSTRDTVLAVLLLGSVVLDPGLALVWLLLALLVARLLGTPYRPRRTWIVAVAIVVLVVFAPTLLALVDHPGPLLTTSGLGEYAAPPGPGGMTWYAVALDAAIVGVLLADEAIVDRLVRYRFRPGCFRADARELADGWERTLRLLGEGRFADRIDRIDRCERHSRSGDDADVVVYRGRHPFIGAGPMIWNNVLSLPLTPASGSDDSPLTPLPFLATELHAYVARAVEELRASRSLAPSGRFATLVSRDHVIVPVDQLVRELARQPEPTILPSLSGPPQAHLTAESARRLADHPPEWARYYRCFRVEAWDRNLAASTFFAAGTDQRMLYVELTQCILPPVQHRYRAIDHTRSAIDVVGHALGTAFLLPATILPRVGRLVRPLRPSPVPHPAGPIAPARYGAASGLREQAALHRTEDFFQAADAHRYTVLLRSTIVRAIGRFLEERGYSVVEFMEVARASLTTNNQIVTGNVMFGDQRFHNGGSAAGSAAETESDGKRDGT